MNMATPPRALRNAGLGLALLLCAASASAQMYKWVDASGKTHFTTSPPPPTARSVNVRAVENGPAVALPFALSQAVRNAPVVLYTSAACGGCDMGRDFLKKRGIPFSEKTVSTGNDEAKLKEAGSPNGQLPLIAVGQKRIIGYEAGLWDSALTAASYPAQKILPNNYVYPSPVAAAPPPAQVAAAAPPPPPPVVEAPKAPANQERTAPPGFQF